MYIHTSCTILVITHLKSIIYWYCPSGAGGTSLSAPAMFISISETSLLGGSLEYKVSPVSSVAIAVTSSKISPPLVSAITLLNHSLDSFFLGVRHLHLILLGSLIHPTATELSSKLNYTFDNLNQKQTLNPLIFISYFMVISGLFTV